MKSVLMLYPINFFVEEDGRAMLKLNESWFTRALSLDSGVYRARAGLINYLLDQYREQGYKIAWAFFSDSNNVSLPDLSQFSSIFNRKKEDYIVNVGITERQHLLEYRYPDEKKVVAGFSSLSDLIVGGFHHADCVARFASAGSALGIRSDIDRLLIEHFFQAVNESFGQDLYLQSILTGHLDPEMHEDNPFEEQDFLFEGRLGPISTPNVWVSAKEDLTLKNYIWYCDV